MLRVLVAAEIRQDTTRSVVARNLIRDPADYRQHLVQEALVRVSKIDQRRNVPLRNHDDVDWPEWARVVKSKDLVSLENLREGRRSRQSNKTRGKARTM